MIELCLEIKILLKNEVFLEALEKKLVNECLFMENIHIHTYQNGIDLCTIDLDVPMLNNIDQLGVPRGTPS
jgi:hypothetical protein